MINAHEPIQQFFSAYESRFNDAINGKEDIDGTVNSFETCFLEASPAGINCGKNDESLREAIPKGNAYYKSIGTKSMKISKLDITKLDDLHYMVKVYWDSLYEKKDKKMISIGFDVIYFLRAKENEWKIFLYITGDEQKVLKENGLIE
ncbi:MAG TPA: hypothetical protein VJU78_15755 [Chitinophagaceae bacterium]|nr:hypothetical protein [Chitinophagaceae bacterium]